MSDEEATIIRNLLNAERMQYKAIETKEGEYYRTIMCAINAMDLTTEY